MYPKDINNTVIKAIIGGGRRTEPTPIPRIPAIMASIGAPQQLVNQINTATIALPPTALLDLPLIVIKENTP